MASGYLNRINFNFKTTNTLLAYNQIIFLNNNQREAEFLKKKIVKPIHHKLLWTIILVFETEGNLNTFLILVLKVYRKLR